MSLKAKELQDQAAKLIANVGHACADLAVHSLSPEKIASAAKSISSELATLNANVASAVEVRPDGSLIFIPDKEALEQFAVDNNADYLYVVRDLEVDKKGFILKVVCGLGNIDNLSALKHLSKVSHLELEYNIIVDITALSGMHTLKRLWLQDNIIQDIKPLQNLVNLEVLSLSNNRIIDFSPLAELDKLTQLELDNSSFREGLGFLKGLKKLRHLNISGCIVRDLTPLLDLPNLQYVHIKKTEIDDKGLKVLEKLRSKKVMISELL